MDDPKRMGNREYYSTYDEFARTDAPMAFNDDSGWYEHATMALHGAYPAVPPLLTREDATIMAIRMVSSGLTNPDPMSRVMFDITVHGLDVTTEENRCDTNGTGSDDSTSQDRLGPAMGPLGSNPEDEGTSRDDPVALFEWLQHERDKSLPESCLVEIHAIPTGERLFIGNVPVSPTGLTGYDTIRTEMEYAVYCDDVRETVIHGLTDMMEMDGRIMRPAYDGIRRFLDGERTRTAVVNASVIALQMLIVESGMKVKTVEDLPDMNDRSHLMAYGGKKLGMVETLTDDEPSHMAIPGDDGGDDKGKWTIRVQYDHCSHDDCLPIIVYAIPHGMATTGTDAEDDDSNHYIAIARFELLTNDDIARIASGAGMAPRDAFELFSSLPPEYGQRFSMAENGSQRYGESPESWSARGCRLGSIDGVGDPSEHGDVNRLMESAKEQYRCRRFDDMLGNLHGLL